MTSGDVFVYNEALNEDIQDSNFISKSWLYVNDSNSGSYSGQIVLDSLSLSNNSSGYYNWRESFILIPCVLELSVSSSASAGDLPSTSTLDYCVGLKNGFSQLLHSMSVDMDSQNIVQQTPFLNIYSHFRHMTNFSFEQLREMGVSFCFHPDSASSWVANVDSQNTASLFSGSGPGFTNNRVLMRPFRVNYTGNTVTGFTELYGASVEADENEFNEGLKKRCEYLQYTSNTASGVASGVGISRTRNNRLRVLTDDNARSIFKPYVESKVNGKKTMYFVAKVDLRHVCDYFNKTCTLSKGGAYKFYLNVNQCELRFTYTKGATNADFNNLTLGNVTVQNGSVPIMVASGDKLQPLATKLDASSGKEMIVSLSVVRNNFTTLSGTSVSSHSLTTCRLYVPSYVLNPLAEQQMIKLNPTKEIVYDDIQLHIQRGVGGTENSSFNFLCSNGLSNLKEVIVVPLISSNSNGTSKINPLYSPFDPSMVHPIAVKNYNIQVSGKNLYQNNLDYDFEIFNYELKTLGLNSGLTDGLATGLINEYDYSNLYRYLYSNVSRVLPSEDGVARSVNISGTIVPALQVDFYVFMVYSKKLQLDIRTGSRVG